MKLPRGIYYILGTEFAERLSFFGMRSILSLFLVTQFFNPHNVSGLTAEANAQSNMYSHAFSTIVYFTPLLGALLADGFFGRYRIILIGSLIYTFGHLLLSVFNHSLPGFIWGLVTIGIAAGCIKSCTAAFVGDQFDQTNTTNRSRAYSWFYFCINAGGTLSILLIPIILEKAGAGWAFGIPGIAMAVAAISFYSGTKYYHKPTAPGLNIKSLSNANLKALGRVLAVFAFIPLFWGMWDMNQSEWVLQASKLNLKVGSFTFLPAQIQATNGVFLLILLPLFNYRIYPLLEKAGIHITPLRKLCAGFLLTALSFVIIALLESRVQSGFHPSVCWQLPAYLLLTAAEVLIAVTCLEYAYTQSPPAMKTLMTSLFYFTYSIGTAFTTYVNASIASHGICYHFTGASYFWLFACLMFGMTIIFVVSGLSRAPAGQNQIIATD